MLFGNTSSRNIPNLVLYPRSGFGGKIFVLGSIRFNRESIDSRFLHICGQMCTPPHLNPTIMHMIDIKTDDVGWRRWKNFWWHLFNRQRDKNDRYKDTNRPGNNGPITKPLQLIAPP